MRGEVAMSWVRAYRRIGAGVALLALALQLVLSFGHLHLADIASPSAPAVLQTAAAPDSGSPSDRHHRVHDVCAICATLNLTASSLLPAVAALALPFAIERAWRADFESVRISFEPHFLFQARAPPVLS